MVPQVGIAFYLKLVRKIESKGFRLNPYDPCVANKNVNSNQMTITFHVDYLKTSHQNQNPMEAMKVIEWFKLLYGKNVCMCRGPE